MKDIPAPRTTAELTSALHDKHQEIEAYFAGLKLEDLLTPQGEYWSPEGHLRHLVKSVRPLVRGLSVPRLGLLVRFGPNLRGASRGFEEVRDFYREHLARGADAGSYSPSTQGDQGTPEERRERVLSRWKEANLAMDRALKGWGETALDRLRLPHPLLGKMTVREILLWTLYHNHHHLCRVQERAGAPAG